ncbi:hypothetical protein AOLI_G00080490 [Acnodon oligacanthus]
MVLAMWALIFRAQRCEWRINHVSGCVKLAVLCWASVGLGAGRRPAEITVPFQDQLWRSYPPKPSAGRSQGGAFPCRLTGCNARNDQLHHPPVRPTGEALSSLSPAWKNSADRRESAPLSNIPQQHAGPESHQRQRWWMTESRKCEALKRGKNTLINPVLPRLINVCDNMPPVAPPACVPTGYVNDGEANGLMAHQEPTLDLTAAPA